jgi:LysM repeat protein
MSETAPEKPASAGGGKLGVWSKKLGPMPAWLWAGLVMGLLLLFMLYKKKTTATAAAATSTAGTSTSANDVPQFVNQTYTTVTPPAAPDVGDEGDTGPAGPAGPAGPPGTPGTPAPKPVPTPAPKPLPGKPPVKPPAKPVAYVVKKGDTLTAIAKKYGITWQTLYDYNIGSASPHSAQAKAFIKSKGPNMIYAGETFYIPPKP